MGAISQRMVAARVLVVSENNEFLQAWCRELIEEGLAVVAAHGAVESRGILSTEPIRLAVVEASAGAARLDWWPPNQRRPRVLFLMPAFDANAAVGLARAGDLVLPASLERGTLGKAVKMLAAPEDNVVDFARDHRLSPRETELLRHALLGRNNDEAAVELQCTRGTVSTYWNRIFKKTGVSGQRDVIVLLLRSAHGDSQPARAVRVAK